MKAKVITSGDNRLFKMFQGLLRAQGIRKNGLALLSGARQVREVLRDFPERCAGLILRKEQDVFDRGLPETVHRYHLPPALFRKLDAYGTDQPILVVRVEPFPLWYPDRWPTGCTLLVPFQDPTNVGAVIRTAAAFGVARVVMLKEAAHPFHHKSSRVAGSALFRLPLFEGPSIRRLRPIKVPLIALSPDGDDVGRFAFPDTFGLIPGLEGPGIPAGLRKGVTLSVPMQAGVESLNAALATGIVLYLWRSRLAEAQKTANPRPDRGTVSQNNRLGGRPDHPLTKGSAGSKKRRIRVTGYK
ncbi:MAG: RNA methyltransferase [Deltaproteobacteria bacterium]|nr:RNA methyltransferase [Deltaproteobacteria bacterium]